MPSLIALKHCFFPVDRVRSALDLDTVREQSQNALKRTDFYQAMARNEGVIVLAGNTGALLHSEDNGETWTRTPLTTNDSFIAVDACPDGSFIALTFSNILWHGDASAINWTPYTLPSSEQMMTATCSPDGSWWAAGSFTTLQNSSDQGRTWAETSLNEDAILTNIQFLNNSQGVAAGEYGMLLATEDSGENWDYAGYLPDEFYPMRLGSPPGRKDGLVALTASFTTPQTVVNPGPNKPARLQLQSSALLREKRRSMPWATTLPCCN